MPVNDSFSLSYGALTSEDWQNKQPILDRERARVSARARAEKDRQRGPTLPGNEPQPFAAGPTPWRPTANPPHRFLPAVPHQRVRWPSGIRIHHTLPRLLTGNSY